MKYQDTILYFQSPSTPCDALLISKPYLLGNILFCDFYSVDMKGHFTEGKITYECLKQMAKKILENENANV